MAAFTSILLGTSAVLGAGATIYGGIKESEAIDKQSKFQAQQLRFNSDVAEMQADDAIDRGNKEAQIIEREGRQFTGAQRAALAAQGLDPDSGAGGAVVEESRLFAKLDAMTTRNNAAREAFGYRVSALDARNQGAFALAAGQQKKNTTLLTSGLGALSDLAGGAYKVGKGISGSSSPKDAKSDSYFTKNPATFKTRYGAK